MVQNKISKNNTKICRDCLVYALASQAKLRARQNFGEEIIRPCFASAWAQKQA
jgi:hypothetical protein